MLSDYGSMRFFNVIGYKQIPFHPNETKLSGSGSFNHQSRFLLKGATNANDS